MAPPDERNHPSRWPAGTSTGVGSMPGDDPLGTAKLIFDTVTLPFLGELPDRGVGADLVARGTTFLPGLSVDLQPSGWRLVPRPGRDSRRTADLLARDLDALEEAAEGYAGPLKVQACGPWTLAAALEMSRGGQALSDSGAARDLAASLAEGLVAHVRDLRRRLPGVSDIFVQLDEPSLAAVAAGHIRTASGFATLRTPDTVELATGLAGVCAAVAGEVGVVPGAHLCSGDPPVALLCSAGARFISIDTVGLGPSRLDDELGQGLEDGAQLIAGAVPTSGPLPGVAALLAPVLGLARRLGMSEEAVAGIAVSPACGIPAMRSDEAQSRLRRAAEAARELAGG